MVIIAQLEPRNRQSLWTQFQYALELSGDETEEEAPALMEVCTENVQVTRQLQTAEGTSPPNLTGQLERAEGTCCLSVTDQRRLPEAIDSHFHLDRTRTYFRLPAHTTVTDVIRQASPCDGMHVDLVGTVPVFCDPDTYPTLDTIKDLTRQGHTVAVGLHPKQAARCTDADLTTFGSLLTAPETVGFGEVGLDETVGDDDYRRQFDILDRILPHLEDRHVLILHCREARNSSDGHVYHALLELLKPVVHPHHPIHLHCFCGGKSVVDNWLNNFPRTYFGFTQMAGQFKGTKLDGLRSISPDRLLLETDAPYFPFRELSHSSTPALIGMTARTVARQLGMDWTELLRQCTDNAKCLYGWSPQ
ncbi:MAG: TatD family hydrolase [Sedimenticola sp.]